MSKKKHLTNQWWRWPFVPVAAFGALWLVANSPVFPFGLGQYWPFCAVQEVWFISKTVSLLINAIGGFAYSSAAIAVAPYRKVTAGIVVVALISVMLVSIVIDEWFIDVSPYPTRIYETLIPASIAAGMVMGLKVFTHYKQ